MHAIAAEVWQGQHKILVVEPVHCVGLVPSQVMGYVGKLLKALEERYGIRNLSLKQNW